MNKLLTFCIFLFFVVIILISMYTSDMFTFSDSEKILINNMSGISQAASDNSRRDSNLEGIINKFSE